MWCGLIRGYTTLRIIAYHCCCVVTIVAARTAVLSPPVAIVQNVTTIACSHHHCLLPSCNMSPPSTTIVTTSATHRCRPFHWCRLRCPRTTNSTQCAQHRHHCCWRPFLICFTTTCCGRNHHQISLSLVHYCHHRCHSLLLLPVTIVGVVCWHNLLYCYHLRCCRLFHVCYDIRPYCCRWCNRCCCYLLLLSPLLSSLSMLPALLLFLCRPRVSSCRVNLFFCVTSRESLYTLCVTQFCVT